MSGSTLEFQDLFVIISGTLMGTFSRALTLKADSRQYPSYPNGTFINLVTGFVAAGIGAVAVPALLAGNFVAVTFLAIAIQHFRDIRKMERDSLVSLESSEYTVRGNAYIDGIAKTYEARNFICLITALTVVIAGKLLYRDVLLFDAAVAVITGLAVTTGLGRFTKGHQVSEICSVREGQIEISGSELCVDGIFVSNELGTEAGRTLFREEGVAFVLSPKVPSHRVILENYGQRQAILFEVARAFGVKRYSFTRRSFEDGRVVIAFVPVARDLAGIAEAIERTPVLESSRKVQE